MISLTLSPSPKKNQLQNNKQKHILWSGEDFFKKKKNEIQNYLFHLEEVSISSILLTEF